MKYFLAMMFAVLSSAAAVGSVCEKKVVGLFMENAADILARADDLDSIPWLDGLAVCLSDVDVKTADGAVAKSDTLRVMTAAHEWSREKLSKHLSCFQQLAKRRFMREGFLLVRLSSGNREDRLSWGNDKGWAQVAANLSHLAWFAKRARLKGLMIAAGDSLQYRYHAEDAPSFDACRRLARQRGREVFSALFREYPDLSLFFLSAFQRSVEKYAGHGETDPRQLSDDAGELLPHFYNGVLDILPPTVTFIDGGRTAHPLDGSRWKSAIDRFVGAKPFIEPENLPKYRAHISASQGCAIKELKSLGASGRDVQLKAMEWMLESSDEYIWLSGTMSSFLGARLSVFSESLMLAKSPETLTTRMMEDARRSGALVNLAEGFSPLPQKFFKSDRPTRMEYPKPHSLKGVHAGELYLVSQTYRSWMRKGDVELKVTWRRNGAPVASNASAALLCRERKGVGEACTAQAYVVVPDGADELVVDAAGDLYPGERYYVGTTEIYLLDYAKRRPELPKAEMPEITRSSRRWTYDAQAKKLSDGNWTLTAKVVAGDKTKRNLSVDGRKALGAGVLDFRRVEADTGLKVTSVDGFLKNEQITGLIGPDIVSVAWECFRHCGNLKEVHLSPKLEHLAYGAFSDMKSLVRFSPTAWKADIRLGINIFLRSPNLTGDFSYEGEKELPECLFWGTSITSFSAPHVSSLGKSTFSCCRKLQSLSFARSLSFADDEARTAFLMAQRKRAGLWVNLTPQHRFGKDVKLPLKESYRLKPSPVVKEANPGDLYSVSLSMKAIWTLGQPQFEIKWMKDGRRVGGFFDQWAFSPAAERKDGVWRTASVLVRVPEFANGFLVDVWGDLYPGESYEFDKIEIFKLTHQSHQGDVP